MKNRFLTLIKSIGIIIILITIPVIGDSNSSQDIIIVDNEGDGDYTTIQGAIDHAESGDIIHIYSGLYNETLTIDTTDLTIEGIAHELATGTDDDYPIINGNQAGHVITIQASACRLSTCIIQNSGHGLLDAGILVQSSDASLISNGIVGNHYGILVNNCTHATIQGNYLLSNTMDGIYLLYTQNNMITSNVIKENGFQGIFMWDAQDNSITDNTLSLNGKDGIHLRGTCNDNDITTNTIHSNGIDGIKLVEPDVTDNLIHKNAIYSNAWNGIHIINSNTNTLSENIIHLNLLNGIHIGDADNNKIVRNTIQDNKEEGIFIIWPGSTHNQIYYNNIINDNAFDFGKNAWDDGHGTGGNYWSYKLGVDENNDGISETPYQIEGSGNIDQYPFIEPLYAPGTPSKPNGPTFGSQETSHTYTTISTDSYYNQIQYGWDWDGDETIDEWTAFYQIDEPCYTSHNWYQNGTYLVKVKAMDNQGFQSDWSEPLSVTMPKTKTGFPYLYAYLYDIISTFFHRFIDIFTPLFSL